MPATPVTTLLVKNLFPECYQVINHHQKEPDGPVATVHEPVSMGF
jgi:hypothetical protein